MLNHLQQVTIQAFITALSELDAPLPADLQKQVNQVGAILSTQTKRAIDELAELAKHAYINQLYLQARSNIQTEYHTQERNLKHRNPQKESETRNTPPYITENIAKAPPLDLEKQQSILQASDSVKEAQKIRRGLL